MNIKTPLISLFALSVSVGAIGCDAEDVDSEAIRTSGIYAEYQALATGDGTTQVRAELRVGGNDEGATYIKLTGEDDLVAYGDDDGDGEDESASMGHNDNGGDRHWYLSRFDTDADNTEFTISFVRSEEDDGAPNSMVAIPKPFEVDVVEDSVERGNDVEITWDNEDGGDIAWAVSGDCIWSREGTTTDDMAFAIPSSEIEVLDTDVGEDCEVTVTLRRIRDGVVDEAFGEGGQFKGIQERTATFMSTAAPGEGEGAGGAGGGSN